MTKAGIGFIVGGVILYVLANQSQIGWLYLFDAILWSLLIISAILPWYTLKALNVENQVLLSSTAARSQLGGPVEDEAVEIKFRVTNGGRFTRHFINLIADFPFEQTEKQRKTFFLASINPKSPTVFSYSAGCYHRGVYPCVDITLKSDGLLGLFVRKRAVRLSLNLTVYPKYFKMEGQPVADAVWAERGRTVKTSTAAEFYGSREYQYGEPLKNIHWRNTAKANQFMLKEFEQTNQGSLAVVLAKGAGFGSGRETTLEYSIKIAASLARLCADTGRLLDIYAGDFPMFNSGWQDSMDYLARLEAKEKDSELTATAQQGQVVVVVVSAEQTELIDSLSHLALKSGRMILVLLEGFAPDEKPEYFAARLKETEIIKCSQGNLEPAIKKLSNVLSLTGEVVS